MGFTSTSHSFTGIPSPLKTARATSPTGMLATVLSIHRVEAVVVVYAPDFYLRRSFDSEHLSGFGTLPDSSFTHTHTLHARTRTHTDVGEAVTIEQLMDGMMLMDHSRDSLDVRPCDVSSFDAELMDALEGERVRCESVVSGEEENPSGVSTGGEDYVTPYGEAKYLGLTIFKTLKGGEHF